MSKRILFYTSVFLLFFLLGLSFNTYAQDDPFRTKKEVTQEERTVEQTKNKFSIKSIVRTPKWFVLFSRKMQSRITHYISVMSEKNSWLYGGIAFFFAILFGMAHVLGPGHGKVFTILYFSSRSSKFKDGVFFSALINIIDSLSAITLVGIGYGVLKIALHTISGGDAGRLLSLFSYGAIVLLGVVHMGSHIFGKHSHSHTGDNNHLHDSGCGHEQKMLGYLKKGKKLQPWMLAFFVGLIPCPISTFIFVYGLVHNIIPFSLLLIFGISIGGFLVMSILGLLVIKGRTGIENLGVLGKKQAIILGSVEWITSSLIILVGIMFFLANL